MGNLSQTIKRFVGNKNTVTILAVVAGIVILWYFYNMRVNQAITTMKIPYAIERVDSGNKIENDNIGYKEVTRSAIRDSEIVTDIGTLNEKYVCEGNTVPKDGFFYSSQVCNEEDIVDSIFNRIPDGYTLFNLDVDNKSTYGDSIRPGNRIDLYVSATDDNQKLIFGKLIESIEVLAVRDASNRDLFWDQTAGTSAILLFAVPDEYHKLLNIATKIPNLKIVPVPRSKSYTQNPGDTQISSDQLRYFIERNYSQIVD